MGTHYFAKADTGTHLKAAAHSSKRTTVF